jgi:hypothetical protein
MSKHERQHTRSHVIHTRLSEAKRVRVENTNCLHCSDHDNLNSLRTNVLILLKKLFPQLEVYYPLILTNDFSVDRLVENLIEIQTFYRLYPSL